MLRTELDIGAEVLQGEAYETVVFHFIEWAESHGMIKDLVTAACRANAYNQDLYIFANNIGLKEEIDREKTSQSERDKQNQDSKRQARIAALSEKDLVYSVQSLEAEEAYLRIKHWLEQNNGHSYAHFIEREFKKVGATSAVQLFINERNLLNRASSKRLQIQQEIHQLEKDLKKQSFDFGPAIVWGFLAFAVSSATVFLLPLAPFIGMFAATFGFVYAISKDSEAKTRYYDELRKSRNSYNNDTAKEILGEKG